MTYLLTKLIDKNSCSVWQIFSHENC